MIAIIPYKTFEIKMRLSQEAARQMLQEIVEPRKLVRFGLSRNHNLFEGEIEGTAFNFELHKAQMLLNEQLAANLYSLP